MPKITTVAKIIDRKRLRVFFIGREGGVWHFRTKILDRDTLKTVHILSAFSDESFDIYVSAVDDLKRNPDTSFVGVVK